MIQRHWARGLGFVVLWIFFIALLIAISWSRFRDIFTVQVDEGINLAKAVALGSGYALYTDIWSNQPPGLAVFLQKTFAIFDHSLLAGRALVAALSALLLVSFFYLLRLRNSRTIAAVACTCVLIDPLYRLLSIRVLVGLPSLALADRKRVV